MISRWSRARTARVPVSDVPMILIDTNVVSELMRITPTHAVMSWFAEQDSAEFDFSAIGEAELRAGAAILPDGER